MDNFVVIATLFVAFCVLVLVFLSARRRINSSSAKDHWVEDRHGSHDSPRSTRGPIMGHSMAQKNKRVKKSTKKPVALRP